MKEGMLGQTAQSMDSLVQNCFELRALLGTHQAHNSIVRPCFVLHIVRFSCVCGIGIL